MNTSEMISLYYNEVNPIHAYCPTAKGAAFSTKFLLKGAKKLQGKIIFMSFTKIGEKIISILNSYFTL